MNPMQQVKLEKVTLNIGIGSAGEKLENAKTLLERISGAKAVYTQAKRRNPTFKIKKGENIGAKVTLRGSRAVEVLKKMLETIDYSLKEESFDRYGNVSFGIKEYIDISGMKYDPKIGMMGFDVCVSLAKPGKRVTCRRIAKKRISGRQKVSAAEAQAFMKEKFGVKIVSAKEVAE
ncbi:MAG: 50S ribosomal protein L5 [Candidatus Micrarchaeia archaeon]|jgi:large subunit ribosomal protein L5